MRRRATALGPVLVLGLALLLPAEGYTSGSTQVRQQGKLYRVTLMTPSMSFAESPYPGVSPEREFHDRMQAQFESALTKTRPLIERAVATLQSELAKSLPVLPYSDQLPVVYDFGTAAAHDTPCRIEVYLSYPNLGTLELSLGKVPTQAQFEALRERVGVLFSASKMGPSQTGHRYRLIVGLAVPFTVESKTGVVTTPALVSQRALIEGDVDRLFAEEGAVLGLQPYDEALPLVWGSTIGRPDLPAGPIRLGIQVNLPGEGGLLELCFARTPTSEQYLALARRVSELFSNVELPS